MKKTTVTESSCDGGYFIKSTRESTDKIVTYDSCESDGIKIDEEEKEKMYNGMRVVQEDGNFMLLENGVVACEGSDVGDVGTFDGVSYTTVDETGLRSMINPEGVSDVSGVCTSNVTNMDRMFTNADAFNQNLSGWDVSNISSAPTYFSQMTSENLPIWGTTGSN